MYLAVMGTWWMKVESERLKLPAHWTCALYSALTLMDHQGHFDSKSEMGVQLDRLALDINTTAALHLASIGNSSSPGYIE